MRLTFIKTMGLCLSMAAIVQHTNAQTTTLYVDAAAATNGNGYTWGTALNKLSDALDSAWKNPAIEEVHVAAGTYRPDRKPYEMNANKTGTVITTTDNRDNTFHIRAGLQVLGGYPAGGGIRNYANNVTRLTGNTNTTRLYHVVLIDCPLEWGTITDETRLDGFTVDSGYAYRNGNLTVNGFDVEGTLGAGIIINKGKYALTNNKIINNSCYGSGGGVYAYYAKGAFKNNSVSGNYARMYGGGLYTYRSRSAVTDNKFMTNRADYMGGGVVLSIGSGIDTVARNIVDSNYAEVAGGGVYLYECKSQFLNNTIVNNTSLDRAGGLFVFLGEGNFIGNLFNANYAGQGGGGLRIINTNLISLTNNTITNNSTSQYGNGGGLQTSIASITVRNNIFYKNVIGGVATVAGADYMDDGGLSNVTFKKNSMQLAMTAYTGANLNPLGSSSSNNLFNNNPLFENINSAKGADGIYATADDGLQLSQASTLANVGNNTYIPASFTKDITGAQRIIGSNIDLGAYERAIPPTVAITSISPANNFCRGGNVEINFNAAGVLPGNTYNVELSHQSGSFYSYTVIGTLTSSGSGVITATIPATQTTGTNYRIRISSTSPAFTSQDNGYNLSVFAPPTLAETKISPYGNPQICAGSTIALIAPANAAYTYQWKVGGNAITGATNDSYDAAGGIYTVVVSSTAGCSTESAIKTVTEKPLPDATFTVMTLSGGNKKLTAATSGGTYQWYNAGGIIAGATARNYTATVTDDYYVSVTKIGCTTVGLPQTVAVGSSARIGSEVAALITLSIQPNPSSSEATISIPAGEHQQGTYLIRVYDMAGREVEKFDMTAGTQASFGAKLPVGMYMVVAVSNSEKVVAKWLKQ